MLTKEQRQKLVEDYAKRHKGRYDPKGFLEEVEAAGGTHPAHGWFTWDDNKAALEYRIWQARTFVRDLKVSFEIQTIGRGPLTIQTLSAPLVHSPASTRSSGGGYVLTNLKKPDHVAELCEQAAADLAGWLARYESAALQAGVAIPAAEMRLAIEALESVGERPVEKAKGKRKAERAGLAAVV